MNVEFHYEIQELHSIMRRRIGEIPVLRKLYHLSFLLGPVIGVVFWRLGWIGFKYESSTVVNGFVISPSWFTQIRWFLLDFGFAVGICTLIWYFVWPIQARTIRNSIINGFYAKVEKTKLFGDAMVELTDDGILSSGKTGKQFLYWSSVLKIEENENYLFIQPIVGSLIWIPKRAFSSDETAKQFRDTAFKTWIKSKEGTQQMSAHYSRPLDASRKV